MLLLTTTQHILQGFEFNFAQDPLLSVTKTLRYVSLYETTNNSVENLIHVCTVPRYNLKPTDRSPRPEQTISETYSDPDNTNKTCKIAIFNTGTQFKSKKHSRPVVYIVAYF